MPERRSDADENNGSAGFRELSAIISIVAIVLTYGFWLATLAFRPLSESGILGGLIGPTLVLVAVEIVAHILLALAHPAEVDVRDAEIARRSTGAAYFVLATGGWIVVGMALFQMSYPVIAGAALGALVIADLVRLISQVVIYRIGP